MEALLRQGQTAAAGDYIDRLGGQVSQPEQERWCAGSTLNAVLCASIGAARQADCEVDADIRFPARLPLDALDLCVILSNALENAVHACEAIPAPRRKISVEALLTDGRRLAISVQNPWDKPMSFDAEGFTAVPVREGHRIGLRSVEAVTKKYNGIFHCAWAEGIFTLKAVLFDTRDAPVSGGGSTAYPPVINSGGHGGVAVSPKRPGAGDRVTITPKPDAGYTVDTVLVTDKNGKEVTVKNSGDSAYTLPSRPARSPSLSRSGQPVRRGIPLPT